MVLVVDYGMGNLRSVAKALESLGASVLVSTDPADVRKAERVVLPGVGAFGDAARELDSRGLTRPLAEHLAAGKPFLGVCLGLQLLFESSEEAPGVKGLAFLKGSVRRFPNAAGNGERLKVPHMGWNQVRQVAESALLAGVSDASYFYFVHSYYPHAEEPSIVLAETDYGVTFPAVVGHGRAFACQFHPEKSQRAGLRLLANFLAA